MNFSIDVIIINVINIIVPVTCTALLPSFVHVPHLLSCTTNVNLYDSHTQLQ